MLSGILSFPPKVIRDCTRLFLLGKNNTKFYSWIQRGYLDKPEKELPYDHEKVERNCIKVIVKDKD